MVALKIGKKSFDRGYRERTNALLELARGLPSRPSASDIHDLRVTARRIQVMRGLLPKSLRGSQASRTFDLSLKSVLKATSQLRDLDTLLETLEHYRRTLPEDIFNRLENQRSDAAARAKMTSTVIVNIAPPGLEVTEISGKKLARRLRKSTRSHGRKASELLANVVQDESKVVELHSLRKEVKKLRYLCELADDTPRELALLTEWQESLGAVHDIDVALDFVRGSPVEFKGKAVSQLEHARHASYQKFVGEYRKDSVGTLAKSKVLAVRPALPIT